MSSNCQASLADQTLLIRGLRSDEIDKITRRIKKKAFIPRRNGRDDNGLSGSQPMNDCRETLMVRLSNAEGLFCQFLAGTVRTVEEGTIRLDVLLSPTVLDPYHVLIKGIPTGHDATAIANRLAERLAAISSEYKPPHQA